MEKIILVLFFGLNLIGCNQKLGLDSSDNCASESTASSGGTQYQDITKIHEPIKIAYYWISDAGGKLSYTLSVEKLQNSIKTRVNLYDLTKNINLDPVITEIQNNSEDGATVLNYFDEMELVYISHYMTGYNTGNCSGSRLLVPHVIIYNVQVFSSSGRNYGGTYLQGTSTTDAKFNELKKNLIASAIAKAQIQ